VAIKIRRTFFKFDSIKDILEAWFIVQSFLWQLKVYIGLVFVLQGERVAHTLRKIYLIQHSSFKSE
jgi:hypothetical protein